MRLVAPCSARAAQRPGAPRMRRAAPSRALQRGRRTCESTELEPFITCSHLCTHVPSGLSGVLSARAAAAAVRAPRRGRAAPALLPGSGGGGGRPAAGAMGARRVLAAVVVRCDPRPLIRGGEGGQERQAGILRCRQAGILRCRQAGILRCRCRETGTEKAAEGGGGGRHRASRAGARCPRCYCAQSWTRPSFLSTCTRSCSTCGRPVGPPPNQTAVCPRRGSPQTPRPAPQRPLPTRVSERAPPRARAQHARRRPPGAGASPLASPTGRRASQTSYCRPPPARCRAPIGRPKTWCPPPPPLVLSGHAASLTPY